MNRCLFVISCLALAASMGAQEPAQPRSYNGSGHVYYAIGGAHRTTLMGVGGGGEFLVYKGLGLGGDIGYLFPKGQPGYGVGLVSANPSYHFVNRKSPGRIVPFVTAGYAAAFRSEGISLWNYGGGATIWVKDRVGVRLEARDYRLNERQFNTSFRVSLAFR